MDSGQIVDDAPLPMEIIENLFDKLSCDWVAPMLDRTFKFWDIPSPGMSAKPRTSKVFEGIIDVWPRESVNQPPKSFQFFKVALHIIWKHHRISSCVMDDQYTPNHTQVKAGEHRCDPGFTHSRKTPAGKPLRRPLWACPASE